MNKFTSALLAVTAFSATVAMAGESAPASATGFYVGANAGAANSNAKYNFVAQNVTGSSSIIASDRAVNFKADAGKLSALFGLFAGYGMQINKAYVGAEVYGGFDTANFSVYDDSGTAKSSGYWKSSVSRKNFFGFAPRAGFFVTPSTMAYIRLGVEFGKWEAKVDPNFATIDFSGTSYFGSGAAANASKSRKQFKNSKNAVSFAPGLGVEVFMTKNLFMRAEYSYLFGPSINVTQDTSGYDNSLCPGSSYAHSFKISQHAMKIGVGYKF